MEQLATKGIARPSGKLGLRVIKGGVTPEPHPLTLGEIVEYGFPHKGIDPRVNEWRQANVRHLLRGMRDAAFARIARVAHMEGTLYGKIIRADGEEIDLGLMGLDIVTNAGVNFIVDAFQNIVEAEIAKFHGLGTGATAAAVGDTALQTELTTQYNPDNTRATGSLAEGAANVFRTVGTNTVDATASPTEWGLLTLSTGAATLIDRVVFSAVALASGDSLQTTFDFTFTSGG